VEVVASLSQGRTAAAQCGFFTQKSVPVIFEPPCIYFLQFDSWLYQRHRSYVGTTGVTEGQSHYNQLHYLQENCSRQPFSGRGRW